MSIHIENISNNTFSDQSSVIRNEVSYTPAETVDFVRIEKELAEIKGQFAQNTLDYQAVRKLEAAAKKRSWTEIVSVARSFAEQFSAAALANLAGAYLSHLLKL